jgi:misacylated tRNA(Ala) deacylase
LTELLFLRDAYRRDFQARVTAVRERSVTLDVTAFYAQGGGQPGDQGVLVVEGDRYAVVDTRKEAGEVWHHLDRGPPAVGAAVRGELDWPRRYRLMRYHSALHVLCGVIYHQFGVLVTGGQMYPDRARMDFALEDLNRDRVRGIEEATNQIVARGIPIRVHFISREAIPAEGDLIRTQINLLPPEIKEVRVVEIVGVDQQADGGTHVQNTAEIGAVRVVRTENKGRINKRMEIVVEDKP